MLQNLAAIGGGILLVAFMVYGFRQGLKVTPDDREDSASSTGADWLASRRDHHDNTSGL